MSAELRVSGSAGCRVRILSPESPQTFGEESEWYEFPSDGHFWFRWRLAALLRQLEDCGLPPEEPLRAFDVGCGTGLLMSQLEKETAWRLDGADLNLAALHRVRAGRGELFYYNVNDRRTELREAYDLTLVCDVIEHVERPAGFLESALWHVRPGGFLLVNVPALQVFHSRFDEAVGHLRRYSRRSLERELDGLGVEVVDVRYWGFLLLPALVGRFALFTLRHPGADVIRKGLVPPGKLADRALRTLMHIELSARVPPPIGASVLLLVRKPVRGTVKKNDRPF